MMVINGTQLTTFDVAPDGESFSINVVDDQGRPATLTFPSECLHTLTMTLPECLGDRFSGGSAMNRCGSCIRSGAGRWNEARRPETWS